MLHLVSGISSLCFFVNVILAPVPPIRIVFDVFNDSELVERA